MISSVSHKARRRRATRWECSNEDCETKYFKISLEVDDAYEIEIENFSQLGLTCLLLKRGQYAAPSYAARSSG